MKGLKMEKIYQVERGGSVNGRQKEESFAKGLNFYKLFWVFFIGSIIGVIVETLFCLATQFRIESRKGLLYGPFNPVYGFGAVVMTVCLHWLEKKRDLWIFLGGMVLGGGFEYLCSLVQELVFGTVSWDYTGSPFSFGGRTSLMYCFFWGILGLLWVKELYPRMSRLIERIPNHVGKTLTWVCVLLMVIDIALSGMAVSRYSARQEGIPAETNVQEWIDRYYPDDLMQVIYPNMIKK